jgi:hypothetical protein
MPQGKSAQVIFATEFAKVSSAPHRQLWVAAKHPIEALSVFLRLTSCLE